MPAEENPGPTSFWCKCTSRTVRFSPGTRESTRFARCDNLDVDRRPYPGHTPSELLVKHRITCRVPASGNRTLFCQPYAERLSKTRDLVDTAKGFFRSCTCSHRRIVSTMFYRDILALREGLLLVRMAIASSGRNKTTFKVDHTYRTLHFTCSRVQ